MEVWLLTYYKSVYGESNNQEVEKVFYKLEDAKKYIDSTYNYERMDEYDDYIIYIEEQTKYESYQIWLDKMVVE